MHNLKFYLFLLLFGVFFTSCEKDDPNIIDPTLHYPSVLSVKITPNAFDTTYLSAIVEATVNPDVALRSVTARILNPVGVEVTSIQLKDDGLVPDSAAGDSKFTGALGFLLDCKFVGTYTVQVVATSTSGLNSGLSNATFTMTNVNNHKPILTNVIAPDSLRRPSGVNGDSVLITSIKALPTDPDGICDVSDVYFHSFRPDGTPTNQGNAIHLYDDGDVAAHCDETAGDGTWSVCIKLVNNPLDPNYVEPQLGNYTFKYNAQDRGLLVSDTLVKFINVHQ